MTGTGEATVDRVSREGVSELVRVEGIPEG